MTRKHLVLAIACAAVLVGTACAIDQSTGPAAPQAVAARSSGTSTSSTPTILAAPITSFTLLRSKPLAQRISGTIHLKGTGGTLMMPQAGLTLYIPRAAVGDTAVNITVTALPGSIVAYDFEPHGAKFMSGLRIQQSLANTNMDGNTSPGLIEGGYFASDSLLSPATGTAQVSELLPAVLVGNSVQFLVFHFSGYLVSTGRQ